VAVIAHGDGTLYAIYCRRVTDAWDLTPAELSVLSLLDFLFEHEDGDTPAPIDNFPLRNQPIWPDVLREAEALQYVSSMRGMQVQRYPRLTYQGQARVEEVRRLRADRTARRRACRTALLRWLYDGDTGHAIPQEQFRTADPPRLFYGVPFTDAEVSAASDYLASSGFVSRDWGTGTVELTAAGIDCVEQDDGDPASYSPHAGHTFHTHFHGPISGQVGVGTDINQTQHQGIDGATLERLLGDVREAAETIDPTEAAFLLAYVDTLRAEAAAEQPDPVLIKASTTRLKQIAAKVGNPALSASVSALTTSLLTAFGLG